MSLARVDSRPAADSTRAWKRVVVWPSELRPPFMDGSYEPGWNWIDPDIDRRYGIGMDGSTVFSPRSRDPQTYPVPFYHRGFHAYTTPIATWTSVLIPVWLAGIVATGSQGDKPVAVAEAMYIDPEVYRAAVAGEFRRG